KNTMILLTQITSMEKVSPPHRCRVIAVAFCGDGSHPLTFASGAQWTCWNPTRTSSRSERPPPILDRRHVLAVFPDVPPVFGQGIRHALLEIRPARAQRSEERR